MPISTISDARAVTYPGAVLQVVNATYNTSSATTSATFVTTGFTATITPKFATSKILLLSRTPYRSYVSSGTSTLGACSWYRGGSAIQTTAIYENGGGTSNATGVDFRGITTQMVVDSPATTSAVTYTLYYATTAGTTSFTICDGGVFYADVILMEIAQ